MLTYFLTTTFILICLLMILVILVQRGRGGGLAGAFGMGGGGGTAFGTKTGDVFTTITVVLFVVFLLMAIGLNYRFKTDREAPVMAPAAAPAGSPTGGFAPLGNGSGASGAAKPSDAPATPAGNFNLPDLGTPPAGPGSTPTPTAPATAAPKAGTAGSTGSTGTTTGPAK